MAEPLRITKSLDDISTSFTVFEADQILTHRQLNDLANYLDDQDRLTRVGLLGVGIVCGLRVALRNERVVVSKGVGVTTDGDLLRLPAERSFDRFKVYDKSAPIYPPFYRGDPSDPNARGGPGGAGGEMLPVFELVAEGERDERATPLGQLSAQIRKPLGEMAAVLLMESYVKDDDLCTGTDCDNLGQGSIHATKLLLLAKSDLAALRENLATLDQAGRSLPEVAVERPLLPPGTATLGALGGLYRTACGNLHEALAGALRGLFAACADLLADLFAADPAPEWLAAMEASRAGFGRSNLGIQYYYDFLKDVAETYNAFRDRLFGETTVCCPDLGAFPKHLLLGGLEGDAAENRTGFYPSPLVSRTAGERAHARFLAGKLDALIRTFEPPAAGREIRITPSRGEDRSLEERAIPYYYEVDDARPLHRAWSWALTQRGMERNNYSYHADSYNPGATARQFTTQIGRFDFFRVEGHLGQEVSRVVQFLEGEIRGKNLPFVVRAVALGPDRRTVVVKPPIRYTDMHRFHYLLRQDMVSQLEDTKRFSGSFKQQVDSAVSRGVVVDQSEGTDGASVRTIAGEKHAAVTSAATAASGKLNRSYLEYAQDVSWKGDISNALTAAGEFKLDLGKVVKTEFITPFDSLIASNHMLWLDWLDDIIQVKDASEDEKLLFAKFLARHPGLEHFAGVTRGGTFVLVYDESKNVVADFMLPYVCCDEVEEAPAEPPRPRPTVKPPFVLETGVTINPSRERFVNDKLQGFRAQIEPEWKRDVQIQRDYVDVFKDSVRLLGNVFKEAPQGGRVVDRVSDNALDERLRAFQSRVHEVDSLHVELLKPGVDPERRKVQEAELRDAETALALAAAETTRHVAESKLDVNPGSDGFTAMTTVSGGLARLSQKEALDQATRGLKDASTDAPDELKVMIGAMMKARGLRG
jgi:hypothetical protein